VIYVSTFSKKLIPALRVGFLVAPTAVRERFAAMKQAMDLGTSALLQHALAEFLERGYLRAHHRVVLPEYRRRRDALHEALQHHLPDVIRWQLPSRGVVLWLSLPPELDPEELYDAARRAGVIVTPGTLNAAHGRVEGGVRLTYCHEPVERLVEGAKRLGGAVAGLLTQTRRRKSTAAPAIHGV
jgi:DNA-binding transcriptional MocR family regulator